MINIITTYSWRSLTLLVMQSQNIQKLTRTNPNWPSTHSQWLRDMIRDGIMVRYDRRGVMHPCEPEGIRWSPGSSSSPRVSKERRHVTSGHIVKINDGVTTDLNNNNNRTTTTTTNNKLRRKMKKDSCTVEHAILLLYSTFLYCPVGWSNIQLPCGSPNGRNTPPRTVLLGGWLFWIMHFATLTPNGKTRVRSHCQRGVVWPLMMMVMMMMMVVMTMMTMTTMTTTTTTTTTMVMMIRLSDY